METAADLEQGQRAALEDAWIRFVESRGLFSDGDRGPERLEYTIVSEASQATEADRDALRSWLSGRTELRAWSVGDLLDFTSVPQAT